MNEKIMLEITSDPIIVAEIIEALATAFPAIYQKYNGFPRDPYSFYMTGHCPSFARILHEIFGDKATIMDSTGHVITKIGNHYFDIRGLIDGFEDIERYRECPIDYLPMVEMVLGSSADHDAELIAELVAIGKNKVLEFGKIIEEERTELELPKAI